LKSGDINLKIVLQRVSRASVSVKHHTPGQIAKKVEKSRINRGLVLLVGVGHGDTPEIAARLAEKICGLRVFSDDQGKMNLDIAQASGDILAISQFTLFADTSRGRRPSFIDAAKPEEAVRLYEHFVSCLRERGVHVGTGEFGADMDIELCNDGPVTILLEEKAAP